MAKQVINIGSVANDGSGDPLRDAFDKANDNFNEIYTSLGGDSLVNILNGSGELVRTGSNKITFRYTNVSNLPAAGSYEGMIAYVDAEAAVYYASNGTWIKLLTDFSNTDISESYTDSLADIAYSGSLLDLSGGISDGQTGQLLQADGDGTFSFVDPPEGGGGGAVSVAFRTVAVDGTDIIADSATDTLNIAAGTGINVEANASTDTVTISATGGGGSESSLQSRDDLDGTVNLVDGGTGDLDITGYKGYALLAITVDKAAWVRVYVNNAARLADAGRDELTDPTADAGVIAEILTTGADTVVIAPGTIGYNFENTVTNTIPCAVTNKSGADGIVSVSLTAIQLEA